VSRGLARRALAQARYSATFQTSQIQLRRLQPSTLSCTYPLFIRIHSTYLSSILIIFLKRPSGMISKPL
jgi:hypothetical protein